MISKILLLALFVTAVASIATVTTTQAHAASCNFFAEPSGLITKFTGSCDHTDSANNGNRLNENTHQNINK